jgi:hypothetical protein
VLQRLEIKGFTVINGLLNIYTLPLPLPLPDISADDLFTLADNEYIEGAGVESRLSRDLSGTNV